MSEDLTPYEAGKRGGGRTLAKYGPEHFKRMSELAVAAKARYKARAAEQKAAEQALALAVRAANKAKRDEAEAADVLHCDCALPELPTAGRCVLPRGHRGSHVTAAGIPFDAERGSNA